MFLEYIRLSISGIIVLLVLCKASHGDDCTVLVTSVQKDRIQSLIEKGSYNDTNEEQEAKTLRQGDESLGCMKQLYKNAS